MAQITNPTAIAFSNEVIRPLSEVLRAFKARTDDALIAWFAGLNTIIGSSVDDTIEDGRDNEGVNKLTGDDVTAIMSILSGIQSDLNQVGVAARIAKPCVRPLQAS